MPKSVKRPYNSTRRQEQAGETRLRILAAAHELFVAQGYGRTTIAEIASTAGVAVETIYAAFRNKPHPAAPRLVRQLPRRRGRRPFRGPTGDPRRPRRAGPRDPLRPARRRRHRSVPAYHSATGGPAGRRRERTRSRRDARRVGRSADSTHAPPTPRPPPPRGNSLSAKPSAVTCWPQPWTARCGSGSSPRAGGPTSASPPGSAASGPRNWQHPAMPSSASQPARPECDTASRQYSALWRQPASCLPHSPAMCQRVRRTGAGNLRWTRRLPV